MLSRTPAKVDWIPWKVSAIFLTRKLSHRYLIALAGAKIT